MYIERERYNHIMRIPLIHVPFHGPRHFQIFRTQAPPSSPQCWRPRLASSMQSPRTPWRQRMGRAGPPMVPGKTALAQQMVAGDFYLGMAHFSFD